jgi:hypothetical protein
MLRSRTVASSKGRWKPLPPARAKNEPRIGGRGPALMVSSSAMRWGADRSPV